VQAGQGAIVEAGADLARVVQLAVGAVVAEQQRAEPDAGSLRVGEPADDELLAVQALELQPVPAAPGPVGRVGTLGDDPLPAQAARFGVVRLAVAVPVLGESQRAAERQQIAQHQLALEQGPGAYVMAVGPQHVEQVDVHGHLGAQRRRRIADSEPALQPGEAGLFAVECHDLAVHDEVGVVLGVQRLGDLRIGAGDVLLVPGHQPQPLAVPVRQAALAVELALEDPGRVGEPLCGERGQLGVEPVGLAGHLRSTRCSCIVINASRAGPGGIRRH
jgi:hypothetical protein